MVISRSAPLIVHQDPMFVTLLSQSVAFPCYCCQSICISATLLSLTACWVRWGLAPALFQPLLDMAYTAQRDQYQSSHAPCQYQLR
jgi:hypothetical protein